MSFTSHLQSFYKSFSKKEFFIPRGLNMSPLAFKTLDTTKSYLFIKG